MTPDVANPVLFKHRSDKSHHERHVGICGKSPPALAFDADQITAFIFGNNGRTSSGDLIIATIRRIPVTPANVIVHSSIAG